MSVVYLLKKVAPWGATLLLVALGAPLWAEELPSPFSLDELLQAVRGRNQELNERRQSARSAAAEPRAVGLLEDPVLAFEWWQQPVNFATVPLMLTLRQPLPWPGTLHARRQVAEYQALTARDRVTERWRQLAAETKRAYFDWLLAERSLAVNSRMHTLIEAMVAASSAKYQVGKTPQAQILKTQSELLSIDNERLDLERSRDEAQARINALLDRPAAMTLPPSTDLGAPPALPSERDLVAQAQAHRPEIVLARDALRTAAAQVAVAHHAAHPAFEVWAAYQFDIHGVDNFTLGVSSTLPFFSARRSRALVESTEAEVAARRAALAVAERRAELEVRTALLQVETARRHERLHAEQLIPLAELTLQSAQAAYQNDRIDLFELLDSARMVRDHHLNHERYLLEMWRRLADLELAVGEDLDGKEVAR